MDAQRRDSHGWAGTACVVAAIVAALFGLFAVIPQGVTQAPRRAGAAPAGIHKIQHVIVIMQENRSFDHYFGTFPGADGIPMVNGVPTVCNPDPVHHRCVKPYADHHDVSQGGPHATASAVADANGGKMDGFVATVAKVHANCVQFAVPDCSEGPTNTNDVMGYRTASDIPNYWTYARDFVLQDHMFQPKASWSLPAHLFMVSEWSASCKTHNPKSCTNAFDHPGPNPQNGNPTKVQPGSASPIYAWTDLTYLLHMHRVSWGYYVTAGTEPDCENPAQLSCAPIRQNRRTPGIWNPLPYFDTVQHDRQVGNIQSVSRFYASARAGTLPAVSWVVPSGDVSEHPPATTSAGQSYVTSLINAVMRGPDWKSSAIFVSWDDWGGFYDHVVPPNVDENGYGLRVPGLVISPYAKRGFVDHQVLSFDAYDKFIEDVFLNGQRLDPKTDGRPDPRPDVRENTSILGNLALDFNFNQLPRPPVILPVHPRTTLTNRPPFQPVNVAVRGGHGRITVVWQRPDSNGGLPITGYEVIPYLAGVRQPSRSFKPTTFRGVMTNLTRGDVYTFKVAARNRLGLGVLSAATASVKA
jgi:phospholipase C